MNIKVNIPHLSNEIKIYDQEVEFNYYPKFFLAYFHLLRSKQVALYIICS